MNPKNSYQKPVGRKRLCIMMPGHWSQVMGGSQYQVKCLIEELEKTGRFEIFYLTRDAHADYQANGYRLIRYGFPGAHRKGVHRLFFEMMRLPGLLATIAPDIIYQRVGSAQTGIAARYALNRSCNMVWHIANESDLQSEKHVFSRYIVYRALERQLLNYGIRRARHIIAQTGDQDRLLEQIYQRRATAVIPNFHPQPKEILVKKPPVKVLWVANLKNTKQPEVFIRLATELNDLAGVRFIMIGAMQGSARKQREYRALISRAASLVYLGPKSQEQVNTHMAEADIFVNTSLWEGFPNTFIQAWMRQVPVVSYQVNPDRLIDRHEIGLFSGSFEKLKHDVADLILNDDLRRRMGRNAHAFARQYFSTANAAKIAQVLEEEIA